MKKRYFFFIFIFFALQAPFFGQTQTIENIKATFQTNKVVITYDLMNAKSGQDFNVQIFSSHNGYASPLTYLSGDVGSNVKPGSNRRVEWDAQSELHTFSGDITFEVRAEIVFGWRFKTPSSRAGVRRGKTSNVTWQGGSSGDNVRIELLNEGKTTTLAEMKNTGQFLWSAPSGLKTGSGYQMRLTSGGNTATSESFSVKSKFPLLLKLAPVLLVGILAPALGGSKGGGAPQSTKLPIPPEPN